MTFRQLILTLATTFGVAMTAVAKDERVYELRRYTATPGQLDAMTALIKDCGLPAFARHGIKLEAAMRPLKNPDGVLVVLYSFPSVAERTRSWDAFRADADWVKGKEAAGGVVKKFDALLLSTTDFSPDLTKLDAGEPGRVFELRTYTATPNNLPLLNGRFRDHTLKLFEKYGMANIVYFNLLEGEPDADKMLVYLLAHKSDAARAKSFDEFRKDADWNAARVASEKAGGGSLTVAKTGVLSVVLTPLEWSPLK